MPSLNAFPPLLVVLLMTVAFLRMRPALSGVDLARRRTA